MGTQFQKKRKRIFAHLPGCYYFRHTWKIVDNLQISQSNMNDLLPQPQGLVLMQPMRRNDRYHIRLCGSLMEMQQFPSSNSLTCNPQMRLVHLLQDTEIARERLPSSTSSSLWRNDFRSVSEDSQLQIVKTISGHFQGEWLSLRGYRGTHKPPGMPETDFAHDRERGQKARGKNQPKFKLWGDDGTSWSTDEPRWVLPSGAAISKVSQPSCCPALKMHPWP